MAKNRGDLEAAGTLDVHKKGIWTLNKSLKLVSSEFELRSRIQQIGRHSSGFFGLLLSCGKRGKLERWLKRRL